MQRGKTMSGYQIPVNEGFTSFDTVMDNGATLRIYSRHNAPDRIYAFNESGLRVGTYKATERGLKAAMRRVGSSVAR